jgi:hypothetical protein
MSLFDEQDDPLAGLDAAPTSAPMAAPSLESILTSVPTAAAPAPAPIMPAQVAHDPKQRLALLASVAAAIAAGPRSGLGGLPGGILQGQSLLQQQANQRAQLEAQQQARLESQRLAQERVEQQRGQARARALESITGTIPTFETKEDYDRFVEFAGNRLLASGFRDLSPNNLRVMFPFAAPTAEKRVRKKLDEVFNNKLNKAAIDSGEILSRSISVDRDGDGHEELMPIADAIKFTKYPVPFETVGTPFFSAVAGGADANGIYKTLRQQAQAEGKVITPQLDLELKQQAIKRAHQKDPEMAELNKTLKELQIDQARNRATGGLAPGQEFNISERLARAWTDATKAQREMNRQFQLMQTGLKRFRQGDKNGGAQAVLVKFQKILDPTSVVRESEYARSAAGLSVLSRLEGYADRLTSGGAGVPDSELAGMVETARQFLEDMKSYSAGQRKRIQAQINKYKLDPATVFDDVATGETLTPPPTKPQTAKDRAAAKLGIKP